MTLIRPYHHLIGTLSLAVRTFPIAGDGLAVNQVVFREG
jgi:hypothetical protein